MLEISVSGAATDPIRYPEAAVVRGRAEGLLKPAG
jgi:hypothetical protein